MGGCCASPKAAKDVADYSDEIQFVQGNRKLPSAHNVKLDRPPARSELLRRLSEESFDVLVIGGGATGVGTALEAHRRGFKVALVERGDFATGTSSRSTQMLHGGVRYLQNALRNPNSALREAELRLVRKGLLQEDMIFNSAPFMVHALPIMVPCYNEDDKEKFGELLREYDELGQDNPFPEAHWMTRRQVLFQFPHINDQDLIGAWVYFDGQQDDARMALLVALTAVEGGACIVNYCNVEELLKDDKGKAVGAVCRDRLADNSESKGALVRVRAKAIINATGPFSDAIRRLDDPRCPEIITPSAGTHLVLPDHFSPDQMGLVVLETSDGRVLFYLPWQGHTLVGTTDRLVEITDMPEPSDEEIAWILKEINKYLSPENQASEADVLSSWAGIRPLAKGTQSLTGTASDKNSDEGKDATSKVTREHVVFLSNSGLVSVAGGKWTTYRAMAKDVVDFAERKGLLPASPNPIHDNDTDEAASEEAAKKPPKRTKTGVPLFGEMGHGLELGLVGSDRSGGCCNHKFHLVLVALRSQYRFSADVAEQLARSYGTRALHVAELARTLRSQGVGVPPPEMRLRGLMARAGDRLHPQHPFLTAQVLFAVRYEYACTVVDVLSRRLRLAQLDVLAAAECVGTVCDIMARELQWSPARIRDEVAAADRFLKSCGLLRRLKYRQT